MPPIEPINDTTYEVMLLSGDKVEIGDKESTDFKPHIKLNRWDGECFIAIQPAGEIEEEVEYEVEGDKIKCKYKVKQGEFEFEWETEFYPLEPRTVIAKDKYGNDAPFPQNELGGFEFEIILKKKPKTNKIVLNIETQGLKFSYQSPLTQGEIDRGNIRPDNVVGSYTVYHATRTPFHKGKADAEKYKCGKAFHIYRPKITDAEGNWVWGELSIDEQAGTLTTTIPQGFLDSAVYPIRIDPEIGNTGAGTSFITCSNFIHGTHIATAEDSGTAISISVSLKKHNGPGPTKCNVYSGTGDRCDPNGTEEITPTNTSKHWETYDFTEGFSVVKDNEYIVVFWNGTPSANDMYYDSAGSNTRIYSKKTYNGWPETLYTSTSTYKYSIYCTYEEAAAGWSHKFLGVANASIGKINGIAIADIKAVNGVE